MSTFKILQINLDAAYNEINIIGREATLAKYPEYAAYLSTSHRGSPNYNPEFFKYYSEVATAEVDSSVELDAALEELFDTFNGYPTVNTKVVSKSRMSSLSVGNIVQDSFGKAYMVDSSGFGEIQV
jgi:hypothetical protein